MDEYPFYIEELVILTIICFLLLIAKLVVCCQSLGLHQNHKALNRRQDYLTIARLNNLQVERISLQEPKREEVITCICKCPQTPSTSAGILPKIESTNPCLKFPEKILVCPRNQCWHAFLEFWRWESEKLLDSYSPANIADSNYCQQSDPRSLV